MPQIYRHRPGLKVEAGFSEESPPLFRYWLSATKLDASDASKTVCAIMQNPSYAGVDVADRSVQVLERVVFEKGLPEFAEVERLIVVNQFAFIQTTGFVGTREQIGPRNDKAISQALDQSEIVLIAWGSGNGFGQRQTEILNLVHTRPGKLLLRTSCHPSRVSYSGFIRAFST